MKPFRVAGWVCALGLWITDAAAIQAAWCNVFQVTCGSCRKRVSASYYVAPVAPVAVAAQASPCCPQPQCTTRYSLRCYYQPVTTYQTKSYYEAVTTYQTSYYYEPVTSYTYSCYYDPCSCGYQQVAVPTTCYQLKSRCCPVQSWVQRCCSVPVTSYQQSFYWEPTTCCTGPAIPANPCAQPQMPPVANSAQPPVVQDPRVPVRPPAVRDERVPSGNQDYDRYYGTSDSTPPASYRQLPANPNAVRPAAPAQPDPRIRLDRITAAPVTHVEGRVVRNDNAPRANVQLLFISNAGRGARYPVTANSAGRFRITLASGKWAVYVTTVDGRQVLHSKITVQGDGTRQITLVSR